MPDALAETMIPPSGPTMADLLGKVAPALSATSDLPADVPAVVKAPPTSASNEAPSKDAAVPADKPVDAKDDSATKTEHVEDEPDSGEQGDATDAAPVADAKAKTPRGVQKRLDELTAPSAEASAATSAATSPEASVETAVETAAVSSATATDAHVRRGATRRKQGRGAVTRAELAELRSALARAGARSAPRRTVAIAHCS